MKQLDQNLNETFDRLMNGGIYTPEEMVGRGLRLWPDKPDCIILTVSPADAIGFMLPEDILGEPPKVRAARPDEAGHRPKGEE